jgi:hypothetical protein
MAIGTPPRSTSTAGLRAHSQQSDAKDEQTGSEHNGAGTQRCVAGAKEVLPNWIIEVTRTVDQKCKQADTSVDNSRQDYENDPCGFG